MGIIILPSTLDGGYTPICNKCGATENFDISEAEYEEARFHWDNYWCKDCIEWENKNVVDRGRWG